MRFLSASPCISRRTIAWLRYWGGPRTGDKSRPAFPLSPRHLLLLALACAAALYLVLTEFELLQLLGLYLSHVFFPRRLPDPCAPCGCLAASDPLREYCASDLGPLANRYSEPPLTPPSYRQRIAAAFDSAARPRMAKAQCVAAEELLQGSSYGLAPGSPPPAYSSPARRTLIHLYSRPDLREQGSSGQQPPQDEDDLPSWQYTTLASILATQPAGSFQVVLWSSEAARPCPPALRAALRAAGGALTYRVFDPVAEARGTPFEGHFYTTLRDRQAYSDSDLFRLLVLLKYGGLYMDMDVYLFRDLTPLLAFEWATEFSADGRAGHGVLFNNAIIHFLAGSPAIAALVDTALHHTLPRLRSWTFGPHLLDRVYSSGVGGAGGPPPFRLMPWCFFHGMWSVGDVHSSAREIADEQVVGTGAWQGSSIMAAAYGLHLHGLPRARVAAEGSIVDVYTRKWRKQ